jgi:hypothetical protein
MQRIHQLVLQYKSKNPIFITIDQDWGNMMLGVQQVAANTW